MSELAWCEVCQDDKIYIDLRSKDTMLYYCTSCGHQIQVPYPKNK